MREFILTRSTQTQSYQNLQHLGEFDSSSDSEDEISITKETRGTVDKFRVLANLDDSDYDIINYSSGWLTCDIVQAVQVLLQEVNPLLEGLQCPTLGPIQNFDVVSGEFM